MQDGLDNKRRGHPASSDAAREGSSTSFTGFLPFYRLDSQRADSSDAAEAISARYKYRHKGERPAKRLHHNLLSNEADAMQGMSWHIAKARQRRRRRSKSRDTANAVV